MSHALKVYEPIAQSIEALLHPYAEVVLHDLKKKEIYRIYNNLSRRYVGDASDLELNQETIAEGQDFKRPYERLNWDGRRMKSSNSVLKDEKGTAIGLLCVNLDISHFDGFQKFLKGFVDQPLFPQAVNEPFSDNWHDRIKDFIHIYLEKNHLNAHFLTREQKQLIIQDLADKGAFKGKNAGALIGRILNLSRATVYKYLAKNQASFQRIGTI